MTYTTGTATSAATMVTAITTALAAEGWTSLLTGTTSTTVAESNSPFNVMQGTGAQDGRTATLAFIADDYGAYGTIHINPFKTWDATTDTTPWLGSSAGSSSKYCRFALPTGTFTYYLCVNSDRVLLAVFGSSQYSLMYAGFLKTFSASEYFKYPYFICGNTQYIPSSTDGVWGASSQTSFPNLENDAMSNSTAVSPSFILCDASSTWLGHGDATTTSDLRRINSNINGYSDSYSAMYGFLYPYAIGATFREPFDYTTMYNNVSSMLTSTILGDLDGNPLLYPIFLQNFGQVLGTPWGLKYPLFNDLAGGDVLTINGTDTIIFPTDGNDAAIHRYVAMELS